MWLGALALRVLVGFTIDNFGLGNRLGPDWATYDFFGSELARYWKEGGVTGAAWIVSDVARYRSGWGMYYFVAAIYYITGRNALATQLICCVFGANTCVLIYRIARMVYPVQRVARLAAILATVVAFTHYLVLAGSQGATDSLPACRVPVSYLAVDATTHSHREYFAVALLSGLYALRHYVFYVVFLGVAASLLFAAKTVLASEDHSGQRRGALPGFRLCLLRCRRCRFTQFRSSTTPGGP